MQEGLNIKIIIHWLSVLLLAICLYLINIDKNILIILIAFLFATLIYNQSTFIRVNEKRLILIKRILFIVPVYRKSFNLSDIKEISFVADTCSYIDFEGVIISKLVVGSYFYDSKWKIHIKNERNQILESDTSLSDKSVNRLELYLSKYLNNKSSS